MKTLRATFIACLLTTAMFGGDEQPQFIALQQVAITTTLCQWRLLHKQCRVWLPEIQLEPGAYKCTLSKETNRWRPRVSEQVPQVNITGRLNWDWVADYSNSRIQLQEHGETDWVPVWRPRPIIEHAIVTPVSLAGLVGKNVTLEGNVVFGDPVKLLLPDELEFHGLNATGRELTIGKSKDGEWINVFRRNGENSFAHLKRKGAVVELENSPDSIRTKKHVTLCGKLDFDKTEKRFVLRNVSEYQRPTIAELIQSGFNPDLPAWRRDLLAVPYCRFRVTGNARGGTLTLRFPRIGRFPYCSKLNVLLNAGDEPKAIAEKVRLAFKTQVLALEDGFQFHGVGPDMEFRQQELEDPPHLNATLLNNLGTGDEWVVLPFFLPGSVGLTIEDAGLPVVPAVTNAGIVADAGALQVTWTNAGKYDEIYIFRDCRLKAILSGSTTFFTDIDSRRDAEYTIIAVSNGQPSEPMVFSK